jgi:large subunit ribosomal protein L25
VTGKKVGRVRREGLVPGTVYGPDITPVNVQFPYRPLQVALMKAGGTNIIDLTVEGGATYQVLAHEVQRDVVRGDILHVDFVAVSATKKLTVDIPLVLVGESPAVLAKQAIVMQGASSVSLELLPSQLVNQIEIDLRKLKTVGDAVFMKDLGLAADIRVLSDEDELVVKLVQPSSARAAEADDLEAGNETVLPEVIGKGKTDEEAED